MDAYLPTVLHIMQTPARVCQQLSGRQGMTKIVLARQECHHIDQPTAGTDRAKRTVSFDTSPRQLCINFANEKLQQHFNSHMPLGFGAWKLPEPSLSHRCSKRQTC